MPALRNGPPPPANKSRGGGETVRRGPAPRGILSVARARRRSGRTGLPSVRAFPVRPSFIGALVMTNDAKFGLVVGVGLVVLVAVVFYRQELATQSAAGGS